MLKWLKAFIARRSFIVTRATDELGRSVKRVGFTSNKYLCDECERRIKLNEGGYLLTTKEVVLSVESWRRVFAKWEKTNPALSKDHFLAMAYQRASFDTPWVVCENCSLMHSFDRERSRNDWVRYRQKGEFQGGQRRREVSDLHS